MSNLKEEILNQLYDFNDIDYSNMFLNMTKANDLEKIFPFLVMNEYLIEKYITTNEISQEVCEFLFDKYPHMLKKDNVFIKLFNHNSLSNEYLMKKIPIDIIENLEDKGLITYFYKDGDLTTEGIFRLFDLYTDIFFKKESKLQKVPIIGFYGSKMAQYEKYPHIVRLFANEFRNPNNLMEFDEKAIAIFYNMKFIDINDISLDHVREIRNEKFFNLKEIIDNKMLSKDIINKLFNFEAPLTKDDLSFSYKDFIKNIPADLINEKDKKGNSILKLLEEMSNLKDVEESLNIILNKGYDITTKDNKNNSILVKDLSVVFSGYYGTTIHTLKKNIINFIFENTDKYLENKEVICEIMNKLLFETELIRDPNHCFMEKVFANKEKEKLNNLLNEKEPLSKNNIKRL